MRKNIIHFLLFTSLLAGCSTDKVKTDCASFDKGFIEACNKLCPSKCTEMASQSKAVKSKYQPSEIEEKCKTSCTKHCGMQLEKVRPPKCIGKK